MDRQLAVVTEASFGAGYDLAVICAQEGFDLLIASAQPGLGAIARKLRARGARVEAVSADVTTSNGVQRVMAAIDGRPVDALLVHTSLGSHLGYFEQDFATIQRAVDANMAATLSLIGAVASNMRERGVGSILLAGSRGDGPCAAAVHEATEAFLACLTVALQEELRDSGVAVARMNPATMDVELGDIANGIGCDRGVWPPMTAPFIQPANVAMAHSKGARPSA